jgi:hypothetical protein
MAKEKSKTINVQGIAVNVKRVNQEDYISLTDIAKHKNPRDPKDVVKNWMRTRNTIKYLALWEELNNPGFNRVEIDPLLHGAGDNAFTLSPTKWITLTSAVGMRVKASRGGGTYAHIDIAFEFATWVSPEFKLYLVSEFKRLKQDEQERLNLEWNLQRTLAKICCFDRVCRKMNAWFNSTKLPLRNSHHSWETSKSEDFQRAAKDEVTSRTFATREAPPYSPFRHLVLLTLRAVTPV